MSEQGSDEITNEIIKRSVCELIFRFGGWGAYMFNQTPIFDTLRELGGTHVITTSDYIWVSGVKIEREDYSEWEKRNGSKSLDD